MSRKELATEILGAVASLERSIFHNDDAAVEAGFMRAKDAIQNMRSELAKVFIVIYSGAKVQFIEIAPEMTVCFGQLLLSTEDPGQHIVSVRHKTSSGNMVVLVMPGSCASIVTRKEEADKEILNTVHVFRTREIAQRFASERRRDLKHK
jgi:hypothetical protein